MEQKNKSIQTEFYIHSSDKTSKIHGIHWMCGGKTRAVLQIAHGMIEHIGRYSDFAKYLNSQGIAVIGHDHLGHGRTTVREKHGIFAGEQGAFYVLEDINRVSAYTKRQYPNLPHFLMGHSMGSFFVRRYLTLYPESLSGVIIMGTGEQLPIVLKTGYGFIKTAVKKAGRESFDQKLHKLILGGYNKGFEPGETEHDWLSRDVEQAMRYEADPDCQFIFSNGAYQDFFQVMLDLSKEKQFENIPKTLPILLVSGACDPVGQQGKGVKRVYKRLIKRELSDVTLKLYSQARHELLNEINNQEVFRDIRSWLDGHIR